MRFLRIRIGLCALFYAFSGLLPGSVATLAAGEYRLGRLEHPVEAGSTEGTKAGVGTLEVTGLVDGSGRLVSRLGRFAIARSADTLFFRVTSELPPEGELLARVAPERSDSSAIAMDDTVEIWLAPLRADDGGKVPTHQLMVNPLGATYSTVHGTAGNAAFRKWTHGATVKSRIAEGRWVVEAAIPLASLDDMPATLDGVRFRVARNWKRPSQASSSEAFAGAGGYSNPQTMSRLLFSDHAPAVRLEELLEPGRKALDLHIALSAPSAGVTGGLEVKASFESTTNVAPRVQNGDFKLQPGETEVFTMQKRLEADTDFHARLEVTGAEGLIFQRQFSFSTGAPQKGWRMEKETVASRFRIAYSPYRKLLLVEDWTRKYAGSGLELAILHEGKERHAVRTKAGEWLRLPGQDAAMLSVKLPGLAEGEYSVRLTPEGEKEAEVHALKVEKFGWEHNAIGKGETVPVPFVPVRAEGKTASVLLRDYTFDDAALPSTVHADDVPVLFAGAKVEGRIGGRPVTLQGHQLTLSRGKAENGDAVFTGQWKLGPLSGHTTASVSYDGLVRTELTLPAAPGVTLEELTLRIPLRNGDVQLMHQIGAGIRANYAGAIPKGEGVIWSNRDAMSYGYPDDFIPYLWVGGIRRGLAVMADSGSGWSIGAKQSSLRLVRDGERLWIEMQWISAPVTLEQGRTLAFAWQATPIKNKPENWRSYSFGPAANESVRQVRIHGSGLYWGAISSFGDVYPRDRDERYLQEMVRTRKAGRVTPETEAFIAEQRVRRPAAGGALSGPCALRVSHRRDC